MSSATSETIANPFNRSYSTQLLAREEEGFYELNNKRLSAGNIIEGERRVGDVIYYDCSSVRNRSRPSLSGIDHVGMYFGNDRLGRPVYIETADPGVGLNIMGPENTYGVDGERYNRRAQAEVWVKRYL